MAQNVRRKPRKPHGIANKNPPRSMTDEEKEIYYDRGFTNLSHRYKKRCKKKPNDTFLSPEKEGSLP